MAAIKSPPKTELDVRDSDLYADIQTNLGIHPNKKDVTRLFNEEAVKRSIRNIILTSRGEKLMNPIFGSNLKSILFDNMTPAVENILKEYIATAIKNHEPRARLISVIVTAQYDLNAYAATIVFNVINKKEPVILEFLIDRVR